ncbi:hypothetical protein QFC21_001957 [Naganishia friedmannii]|uniref:Uncharacterized protein n=1 Tax=Naganishia friedmannii TaxID=89922 RepID=A0ACC2W1E2_9TREE|nr:hypothetical protein QFC21_001957 [Naganishia friedmannii]
MNRTRCACSAWTRPPIIAQRKGTIGAKDNIFWRNTSTPIPTECDSQILHDFLPPFTATAVTHLEKGGWNVKGKTRMDEFGMGSMTANTQNGERVVNPWAGGERSAGGSSGGSAVVVAAGEVEGALGTDTGGSIRLPASYCGVVGLKPSYGMVSRHGVVSYADSLDCVGVLANSASDTLRIFKAVSYPDPNDPTCASARARQRAADVEMQTRRRIRGLERGRLNGLRIGLPIETHLPPDQTPLPLGPLLKHLQALGATLVPISIPTIPLCLPAYYVLACAEASSTLARFGGGWYGTDSERKAREEVRRAGFGREVRKRIIAGTWALTAGAFNNSYLKALQLRHNLRKDYQAVFRAPHPLTSDLETPDERGVDVILHPTAIQTAPLLPSADNNPSQPPSTRTTDTAEYAQDILTVPASLAGLPSVSVPYGVSETDGWPIGVSLTGQWGMERLVLDVARVGVETHYEAGQAAHRHVRDGEAGLE